MRLYFQLDSDSHGYGIVLTPISAKFFEDDGGGNQEI